jgi:hypothetical protein
MTAVALTLYPTRPVEEPVRQVTRPVTVDLDAITESTTCSCNAGDDYPN